MAKRKEIEAPYWRVHTTNMLKEVLVNQEMAIMSRPFDIFAKILYALADRAREINDPELNSLMCRLTLFSTADPESEDYDERAIDLIRQWDAKLLERLR